MSDSLPPHELQRTMLLLNKEKTHESKKVSEYSYVKFKNKIKLKKKKKKNVVVSNVTTFSANQ